MKLLNMDIFILIIIVSFIGIFIFKVIYSSTTESNIYEYRLT